MFLKNVAITGFTFALVNKSNGDAITTGTATVRVSKDGGAQLEVADSPATHISNGQWKINITAAEMNADVIGILITHTSAIPIHFTIKTEPSASGNIIHTYVVLDENTDPIPDVLVEAKIGDVVIQTQRTDETGTATFYLNAGTYDFYATKAGYSFTNPDTEVVS